MIRLVSFLGNFGAQYERTRHNVAWQFAKSLPFSDRLFWQEKFKGDFSQVETRLLPDWFLQTGLCTKKDGSAITLLEDAPNHIFFQKPLTYMNLSGEAIFELAHFYKIAPEEILVVHDELELPFGTVSLKFGGGLGGHNGLRSTKNALGTPDFWRLRFGLSKPAGIDVSSYVLSRFRADEESNLPLIFGESARLFAKVLVSSFEGAQRLLSAWSKKKIVEA